MPTFNTEKGTGLGLIIAKGDIQLLDKESPYLVEASGQAPPEDVGGVSGFLDFRKIMLDPRHPEYAETKEWAGYWQPELSNWESRPHVVH